MLVLGEVLLAVADVSEDDEGEVLLLVLGVVLVLP